VVDVSLFFELDCLWPGPELLVGIHGGISKPEAQASKVQKYSRASVKRSGNDVGACGHLFSHVLFFFVMLY